MASIHLPFFLLTEMGYGTPDERQAHVAHTIAFIRKCAPFQCRHYTLHGGLERTNEEIPDRSIAIGYLREALRQFLPVLQEQNASLNVELLPRNCLGNSPEELESIVEGFPVENIGICLDVNHLNNAPEQVPQLIKRFGTRLKSLHISDYDGVDECHWLPPYGCLDWGSIMKNLREVPQDILLIFEYYTALQIDSWSLSRSLAVPRISSFEKTAAILESIEKINWDISF